jgi:hypothetical protein
MPVALYMDVHVPGPVTTQPRRRGVDVLTAQDDGHERASDSLVLARATSLRRVVFTQDVGSRMLAENWQRQRRSFAGLLFGPQLGGTIGQDVADLELIATASAPDEWEDVIEFLPLPRRS